MHSTCAEPAPRLPCNPARRSRAGLLLVVEGPHDIEFLRRISRMLHRHHSALPDLAHLDDTGRLVFIPVGGGRLAMWTRRFASLGLPEVHLYDRESPPETALREQVVADINRRPGCLGLLTTRRSLEHYLHPATVTEVFGLEVPIGDDQPLAEILASAGAENWVVTRIEEQTLATFRQARRGRPTQDMQYIKKESTRFELTYHTDPARMAEDARSDGVFPLVTNDRDFLWRSTPLLAQPLLGCVLCR